MSKFVEFDTYCKTCIHEKKKEEENPCDCCIEFAARDDYSKKPLFWIKKDSDLSSLKDRFAQKK